MLSAAATLRRLRYGGRSLTEEETRAVSGGLTEEQLAIFDLLTRLGPSLTADEEQQVKSVAEEFLAVLKREKLVLDWRKGSAPEQPVTVEETLDRLPEKYTRQIYAQKCDALYQHGSSRTSTRGRAFTAGPQSQVVISNVAAHRAAARELARQSQHEYVTALNDCRDEFSAAVAAKIGGL